MKSLIYIISISLVLLLVTQYPYDYDTKSVEFQEFKLKFAKSYSTQIEEDYRKQVYLNNLQTIERQNMKVGKQVFGVTQFADLTQEEFVNLYLTLKPSQPTERASLKPAEADTVDWRGKHVISAPLNQGACGSCWAFSTVGLLEGYFAIQSGELALLSQQQLVDCSRLRDLNHGCQGGDTGRALNYVKRNGITTSENYPYTGIQESCQQNSGTYRINGHVALEKNEESLIAAIEKGPVSVSVDATSWQFYKPYPEVYYLTGCEFNELNHAVVAIGYMHHYYIIQNSWGTGWGVLGYMYLGRGANECGIENHAFIVKE